MFHRTYCLTDFDWISDTRNTLTSIAIIQSADWEEMLEESKSVRQQQSTSQNMNMAQMSPPPNPHNVRPEVVRYSLMSYFKLLLSFWSSYFTKPAHNNYLRISGLPSLGTLILITLTTSGGTTTMLPTFYKNLKPLFKTFIKKALQ